MNKKEIEDVKNSRKFFEEYKSLIEKMANSNKKLCDAIELTITVTEDASKKKNLEELLKKLKASSPCMEQVDKLDVKIHKAEAEYMD